MKKFLALQDSLTGKIYTYFTEGTRAHQVVNWLRDNIDKLDLAEPHSCTLHPDSQSNLINIYGDEDSKTLVLTELQCVF